MAKAISRGPNQGIPGLVATGDLSSSQYKLVKISSTAGAVKVGSAATDDCIGVLYNDPTDGQPAEVVTLGVVAVLAEASVSAGNPVACSTTGRVKATTTSNNTVVGYALEASSAAGDLISILFSGPSNY